MTSLRVSYFKVAGSSFALFCAIFAGACSGGGEKSSNSTSTLDTTVATAPTGNTSTASTSTAAVAALTLTPASVSKLAGEAVSFQAAGGVSPYTFQILSGGGTIDASTGAFVAPASSSSVVVQVTDSGGRTASAVVTVGGALSVSPSVLDLVMGQQTGVVASGGFPPYTYSIVSGVGTVGSSSGNYTAPATVGSAVIRATDTLGNSVTVNVAVYAPLVLSPASVSLSVNDIHSFSTTGGEAPYAYSVVSGGGSISTLSGAFTAPATSGLVTVRVTDFGGRFADSVVTVNASLQISPVSVTTALSGTYTFSAAGGVGPYSYSVTSGSGTIGASNGQYTAGGVAASEVIQVVDSLGHSSTAVVTVLNPVSVSAAVLNLMTGNAQTFTAAGGTPPYVFSVTSGDGTIDDTTGAYTAGAPGNETIRATDSLGWYAETTTTVFDALTVSPLTHIMSPSTNFLLTIAGGVPPLTEVLESGTGSYDSATHTYSAPSSNTNAVVRVTDAFGNSVTSAIEVTNALLIAPSSLKIGVNQSFTFTASGGHAPYVYSVASGLGSIGSSSGVYLASATAGDVTVRVTDSLGAVSDSSVKVVRPVQLVAGAASTCARMNEGSVKCWGAGGSGRLGTGSTAAIGDGAGEMGTAAVFVNLGEGRSATKLSMGPSGSHVCAILDNGSLKCWGANSSGQLGYGDTTARGGSSTSIGDYLPVVNLGANRTVVDVSAGTSHTCALLDNSMVKCWGLGTYGRLGSGATATIGSASGQMGDSLAPVNLGTVSTPVSVHSGNAHSCVIFANGGVKCFGQSQYGKLGSGALLDLGDASSEMGDALPFVNLGTGVTASAVAIGTNHSCFLTSSGVKCVGRANRGNLGNQTTTTIGDATAEMGNALASASMGTGFVPVSIATGAEFNCALSAASGLKCWGYNLSGQLGRGNTTQMGSATNTMGDSLALIGLGTGTVSSFAVGASHVCAIMSNDAVRCWGLNSSGQLGLGHINAIGDGASEMGSFLVNSIY